MVVMPVGQTSIYVVVMIVVVTSEAKVLDAESNGAEVMPGAEAEREAAAPET